MNSKVEVVEEREGKVKGRYRKVKERVQGKIERDGVEVYIHSGGERKGGIQLRCRI